MEDLRALFDRQRFAVLATTQENGRPYTNLMAFAVSNDLQSMVLVTGRATRKYKNLCANPGVALLIDNRSHEASDIHEAMAVTVLGEAQEVSGDMRKRLTELFLSKHPYLKEFALSPSCALLQVIVKSYYLVRRFQEVTEFHLRP